MRSINFVVFILLVNLVVFAADSSELNELDLLLSALTPCPREHVIYVDKLAVDRMKKVTDLLAQKQEGMLSLLRAIKDLAQQEGMLSPYSLDLAILADHSIVVDALIDAGAKPSKYSKLLVDMTAHSNTIRKFELAYQHIAFDPPQIKPSSWSGQDCPELRTHPVLGPVFRRRLVLFAEEESREAQEMAYRHAFALCIHELGIEDWDTRCKLARKFFGSDRP